MMKYVASLKLESIRLHCSGGFDKWPNMDHDKQIVDIRDAARISQTTVIITVLAINLY